MGEAKILLFPLLKNKSHHFWLQERVSVKLNMDNKYKALEEHPPSYNESVGQPSTLPLPTYPLPSANPPVVVTDIPNPGLPAWSVTATEPSLTVGRPRSSLSLAWRAVSPS